ncbi:PrsW family intramembrane metalloprotease [Streptomyces sp. DSM 44915]|uniref:PrsW family intramembrane metalloprotease n=1 Tax=Streptomyces chisholmiae TaxID=3075540 RepID=A0ABU2JZ97_9ACTN|nr:PrsW family intramembrane metalloprotease [Streptomyces sp. DSM 44915]MDT0270331.1 PrsW family intramembrane metalloprotease [Streptomyces sp. DSM 44915]
MRLSLPPRLGASRPRTLLIGALLALCGLVVGAVIHGETGTGGFWVGVGLAALPLPVVALAVRWLGPVAPAAWRAALFAFGWGACVATLVALTVNGLLVRWLTAEPARLAPSQPDTLELTVIAPMVEETAKAGALLVVWLGGAARGHRVLVALAVAGCAAAGFAFTENVLYLGSAFEQDQRLGSWSLSQSATAVTFVVRMVVAPFAHPLFSALTGLGFGLAMALGPARERARRNGHRWRVALPLAGLALAMVLHSVWNAATSLSFFRFAAVYLLTLPLLGVVCWLAVSLRRRELRMIRRTLTHYVAAGWLAPGEPAALGSPGDRARARRAARHARGAAGARALADYQRTATELARLRNEATLGRDTGDFPGREHRLLERLWQDREFASATTLATAEPPPTGTVARPD